MESRDYFERLRIQLTAIEEVRRNMLEAAGAIKARCQTYHPQPCGCEATAAEFLAQAGARSLRRSRRQAGVHR